MVPPILEFLLLISSESSSYDVNTKLWNYSYGSMAQSQYVQIIGL